MRVLFGVLFIDLTCCNVQQHKDLIPQRVSRGLNKSMSGKAIIIKQPSHRTNADVSKDGSSKRRLASTADASSVTYAFTFRFFVCTWLNLFATSQQKETTYSK